MDYFAQSVHAYETSSSIPILDVKLHTNPKSIAASPNSGYAAIGTERGVVIADLCTFYTHRTLEVQGTSSVSFSPNANYLATGSDYGIIRLFSVPSFTFMTEKHDHGSLIHSLAFAPSSALLVSGSWDRNAIVWGIPSLDKLRVLRGHDDSVNAVVFISQSIIATGSNDNSIRFWSSESGECISIIREHTQRVNSLALSPRGVYLASGSEDKTVRVYDASAYKCLRVISFTNSVWRVVFASSERVYAGVYQSEVVGVDVKSGAVVAKLQYHDRPNALAAVAEYGM